MLGCFLQNANLQRVWPLNACVIPHRAIQLTLPMTLAVQKCAHAKVINTTDNWSFTLVMCSYTKNNNAHYNLIFGEKNSTCDTQRRNIHFRFKMLHSRNQNAQTTVDWIQWAISGRDSQQRTPYVTSNSLACESARITVQGTFQMEKDANANRVNVQYTQPFPRTDTPASKLLHAIYDSMSQVKRVHFRNPTTRIANIDL